MAITGQQNINIGLPNESANSDSLYSAFTKTQTNFNTLFGNASPYNTFNGGNGISVSSNANTGVVTVTNTGVTSIVAGTNIVVNQSNGAVTISTTGGGNGGGGTVTSVGVVPVSNTRLTVAGSPVVASGNIGIDLATTGISAGTYTNPTLGVDAYGRVVSISNNTVSGTVTSVGVTPGNGIQVSGGPITNSGNITITNTGVTKLNAGSGISLSASNGEVTISSPVTGGTVTYVALTSTTLTVTGSPIVSSGTLNVDLPANVTVTGRLRLSGTEDLANGAAANLGLTATYFSTSAAETGTLAAGTEGQIKTFMMYSDGGDMVITVTNAGWKISGTGTMTFDTIGESCTLQYVNNKWFCIGNNGVVFA